MVSEFEGDCNFKDYNTARESAFPFPFLFPFLFPFSFPSFLVLPLPNYVAIVSVHHTPFLWQSLCTNCTIISALLPSVFILFEGDSRSSKVSLWPMICKKRLIINKLTIQLLELNHLRMLC